MPTSLRCKPPLFPILSALALPSVLHMLGGPIVVAQSAVRVVWVLHRLSSLLYHCFEGLLILLAALLELVVNCCTVLVTFLCDAWALVCMGRAMHGLHAFVTCMHGACPCHGGSFTFGPARSALVT